MGACLWCAACQSASVPGTIGTATTEIVGPNNRGPSAWQQIGALVFEEQHASQEVITHA